MEVPVNFVGTLLYNAAMKRKTKQNMRAVAQSWGNAFTETAAETLWPTRCAVCDQPGTVLCARCEAALAYIDWWQACPRCGAPLGRTQCTECNDTRLEKAGLPAFPFTGGASAVVLNEAARRIVTTFKDLGEQRLALPMARVMTRYVPPAWKHTAVTFIPATASAVRRRNFDHAELLAREVARLLHVPCLSLFERPRSNDQRALSRRQRQENMANRLTLRPCVAVPPSLIIIDDVCTTGATLYAAACALQPRVARLHFLTFARVW